MELSEKLFHYVSVEEALEKILKIVNLKPRTELVDVREALGRVLAEDVDSPVAIPPGDVAHLDGYAVRSSDTSEASPSRPVRLKIVGQKHLIGSIDRPLGSGEAVYVVTGSVIPMNSDAVIPIERVRVNDGFIEVIEPVRHGENVTRGGSDVMKGKKILLKGSIIRPQDIRLLMDLGVFKAKVYTRPRVALLGVGDELTDEVGQIGEKKLETATIMLSYVLREFNADPVRVGVVPDSPQHIRESVEHCLEESDLVVTVGGVSLGVKDLCWTTLSNHAEAVKIARGLRIQPGRATSAVVLRGKPVIMLPGHVHSTICGAYYLLLPIVCYIQGIPSRSVFPRIPAEMGRDFVVKEYRSFKRIRFVKLSESNGVFVAEPVPGDSSMISTLLVSDGFIEIPENVEKLYKGSRVYVHFTSWSHLLHAFFRISSCADKQNA